MLYFQKNYSLDKKEIGHFLQSEQMRDDYQFGKVDSIDKINFCEKIKVVPKLDSPVLHKKAKITDLISTVSIGSSGWVISSRFKELLMQFNCDPDCQIFDIKLIRGQEEWKYLFYYNFYERLDFLDFGKMNFFETSMIGFDPEPIDINSLDELVNYRSPNNRHVHPDKLIFKSPDYDLFRLFTICPGYYASERLKNAIQEAGMTGIDFKPVEELVFLR